MIELSKQFICRTEEEQFSSNLAEHVGHAVKNRSKVMLPFLLCIRTLTAGRPEGGRRINKKERDEREGEMEERREREEGGHRLSGDWKRFIDVFGINNETREGRSKTEREGEQEKDKKRRS